MLALSPQEFKKTSDPDERLGYGLRVYHSFIKPGCKHPVNLPRLQAERIRDHLKECNPPKNKAVPLTIFDASASKPPPSPRPASAAHAPCMLLAFSPPYPLASLPPTPRGGFMARGGENQLGLDLTYRCSYFKKWISGSGEWKGALFPRRS